jgi:hypothetical protein|tara:strand:- start:840 stop:1082 length:243 start_codon:yes stop_codon:yes gene_type:complete
MYRSQNNKNKQKMEHWKKNLDEKGYAIVEDVLNATECLELESGFWEYFGRLSGVKKEDESTWKNIYRLFPNHGKVYMTVY